MAVHGTKCVHTCVHAHIEICQREWLFDIQVMERTKTLLVYRVIDRIILFDCDVKSQILLVADCKCLNEKHNLSSGHMGHPQFFAKQSSCWH